MGPHGIRRYTGDSYFCQDYDRLFSPEERSADFSEHIAVRDAWLRPGFEAQWCLFDPLLSTIFGRRFQSDRSHTADLERQLAHFNRAIAQLTDDWQCPELYYSKGGVWSPNDHTPLAWTQANLAVALETIRTSAR
jgi:phosphorylase kinase alpha/beta subunit